MKSLLHIYKILLHHFGPQDWWPADEGHLKQWEICIGAILTQNTSWTNVEKAIYNLKTSNALGPKTIKEMPAIKLQKLIKPSGFYKQKAARLKTFAKFVLSFQSLSDFFQTITREQLLALNGIGPETADSIMLYACDKPYFVIDAYTRRLLDRIGINMKKENYSKLQAAFHSKLPRNTNLYKEFHALIVEHSKKYCKKIPLCEKCFMNKRCEKISETPVETAASLDGCGDVEYVKTTLHSTGQRPVASPSVKDDMQSCFTTRIPPHHQLQTGGMRGINKCFLWYLRFQS